MRGTSRIDWLNHFLEFIVVVIGILLAFQLNTCSEQKKQQKLVDNHVQKILEETQFNKNMLEGSVKSSKRLLALLDSTVAETGKPVINLRKVHTLSMQLLSLDYLYIKKNAYNSLVQTGDIRYMNDPVLQNDIISLYEYYGWLEGLDGSSRTTYLENYMPYATENFDFINYVPQQEDVYTNKLYRNYLSVYSYSMQFRLQKQEEVLGYMNEFLTDYNGNENTEESE